MDRGMLSRDLYHGFIATVNDNDGVVSLIFAAFGDAQYA